MDYSKLTKPSLIEMCEAKGIAYSSSFTKDKLIELLVEAENASKQTQAETASQGTVNDSGIYDMRTHNTVGYVGYIFGMISTILGFVVFGFLSIFLIGIPLLILDIFAFLSIKKHRRGENNKVTAGLFLFFTGNWIGAILIWVGNNNE